MRHQGLKEAARYFGVASEDREYVPGAEIWATFQRDPERVRRYALRRRAGGRRAVAAAARGARSRWRPMVPKPYERIATSGTGQGLIEPLLVRAYLMHGQALPGGTSRGGSYAGGRTELFTSGVVRHVVKADVASLYPSLMLTYKIGPRSDHLGAFLALLRELTTLRLHHKAEARRHRPAATSAHAHEAASRRDEAAHQLVLRQPRHQLRAVRRPGRGRRGHPTRPRGAGPDAAASWSSAASCWSRPTPTACCSASRTPGPRTTSGELIEEIGQTLPDGISVEHDGRYAAMYSYAEKNYILQRYDGQVRLVGGSFRSSRSERYGEQFLRTAAPLLLGERFEELRALYLETVARLRAHEVPIEDLCLSVILSKSPDTYAKSGRREEQYEVLLGVRPRAMEGRRPRDLLPGAGRSEEAGWRSTPATRTPSTTSVA